MDLGIVNGESQQSESTGTIDPQVVTESPEKIFQERFNQLARKERMLRQQEQQFKAMQERLGELESKYTKIKESPLDALESEFGLKYEDLIAKGLSNDPTTKLHSKIEQLEAKLKEIDSGEKNRVSEARKQQDIDYIRQTLSSNDEFDLVNSLGAYSQIYDKVMQYQEEFGELPDLNEIAQELESDLMQRIAPLKVSKKMRSLFEEKQQQAAESMEGKIEPQEKRESITLSNSFTPSSTPDSEMTSEQDRVKAAIAALKAAKYR